MLMPDFFFPSRRWLTYLLLLILDLVICLAVCLAMAKHSRGLLISYVSWMCRGTHHVFDDFPCSTYVTDRQGTTGSP